MKNRCAFQKKNMRFLQIAKGCKFAGECDWINKNSQNVQNLSFLQKIDGIFERKIWHFESLLELAKLQKNATGIARILKRFKVENLGFLIKNRCVFQKKVMRFLQSGKGCNVAGEREWICEISQNVQKLGIFSKDRWIFRKKLWFVEKSSKLANLPKNATGKARILKTFKVKNLGFLIKLDACFKKNLQLFKNRQR